LLAPKRSRRALWLTAVVVLAIALIVFLVTRPSATAPTTSLPASDAQTAAPDAKVTLTEQRLGRVRDGLDQWLKKHLSYPELTELLVRDDYLEPTDFDDAWGQRVDYTRLDAQHYRLCSRGKDNLPKTEDDVCVGGRP